MGFLISVSERFADDKRFQMKVVMYFFAAYLIFAFTTAPNTHYGMSACSQPQYYFPVRLTVTGGWLLLFGVLAYFRNNSLHTRNVLFGGAIPLLITLGMLINFFDALQSITGLTYGDGRYDSALYNLKIARGYLGSALVYLVVTGLWSTLIERRVICAIVGFLFFLLQIIVDLIALGYIGCWSLKM